MADYDNDALRRFWETEEWDETFAEGGTEAVNRLLAQYILAQPIDDGLEISKSTLAQHPASTVVA